MSNPLEQTGVDSAPAVESLEKCRDLSSILQLAEGQMRIAQMSADDVDKLVAERQKLLEETYARVQANNIDDVYTPLAGIGVTDYERLQDEELLSSEDVVSYKKTDDTIEKMKGMLDENSTQGFRDALEDLGNARLEERADLYQDILDAREVSQKEFNTIIDRIAEIEGMPMVKARLQDMATEEMRLDEIKKEERELLNIESKERAIAETLKKARSGASSLSMRHDNTFTALKQYTGDDTIEEQLKNAYRSNGRNVFDSVLKKLEQAIVGGMGKDRLERPDQVVPWRNQSSSIPYMDALNFLRNLNVQKIISQHANDEGKLESLVEEVLEENEVLHRLYGAPYYTDYKTGQKKEGSFWAAFRTRKENDKNGMTKKIREERVAHEKEAETYRLEVESIVHRGGCRVLVPRYEKKGNKMVESIPKAGAVLVSVRMNKKELPLFEVSEAVGGAVDMKGKTYVETGMPEWLKKGLGQKGIDDLKETLNKKEEDVMA